MKSLLQQYGWVYLQTAWWRVGAFGRGWWGEKKKVYSAWNPLYCRVLYLLAREPERACGVGNGCSKIQGLTFFLSISFPLFNKKSTGRIKLHVLFGRKIWDSWDVALAAAAGAKPSRKQKVYACKEKPPERESVWQAVRVFSVLLVCHSFIS